MKLCLCFLKKSIIGNCIDLFQTSKVTGKPFTPPPKYTHKHTHTYLFIYIYIYVCLTDSLDFNINENKRKRMSCILLIL